MTAAIESLGLTKVYPNGKKASNDLNIRVEPGEIVGLIGPNGAGKTTFIRQLLGLLRPTSGAIRVNGNDIVGSPNRLKGVMSYVPQSPLSFPALTVEETLSYVLKFQGTEQAIAKERIRRALETVGLSESKDRIGYQLSPGMVKLLLLAMALVQETPILVLDEPTAMIDVLNKTRLWRMLDDMRGKKSILLASHDLNEIRELCSRAYLIVNGKVLTSGSPQEISASLSLPFEAKFIAESPDIAEAFLMCKGVRFERSSVLFTAQFDQLSHCIDFLNALGDESSLRYVHFEGPSFELAVTQLMNRRE